MYDPLIDGKRHTFGVSGKLYNAALVMYDRQTNSLWSQLMQQAITGSLTGTRLRMMPGEHTSWSDWKARHPNTLVLSPDTGFRRDYGYSAYEDYWASGQAPRFRRSAKRDERFRPMERVVGVQIGDAKKAYPFVELKKTATVEDVVGGQRIRLHYNPKAESAHVTTAGGEVVPSITTFWFAWTDFYPDTEVYRAQR